MPIQIPPKKEIFHDRLPMKIQATLASISMKDNSAK